MERTAMKIQEVGIDNWNRVVYQDVITKRYYKDTSLNDKIQAVNDLCTCKDFYGEPDTPLSYIERFKQHIITIEYKDKTSSIFYTKKEV